MDFLNCNLTQKAKKCIKTFQVNSEFLIKNSGFVYHSFVNTFCPDIKGYAEIFFKTYMGGWLVGFFSKTKFFL